MADDSAVPRARSLPFCLVLAIYNALSPLLFLALLPGWFLRARARGHWAQSLGERVGKYPPELISWCAQRRPVWIHAVSVGECGVALRLLREWRRQDAQQSFVLTTTTATGRRLLEQGLADSGQAENEKLVDGALANGQVRVLWAPWDLWPWARRAVRALNPAALVLTEGEWWPNWLAQAKRRGVPVMLYNARMSPRSAARVSRLRALVGPLFRQLDWIGLQRAEDAAGFAALDIDAQQLEVTGSVKYDNAGALGQNAGQVAQFGQWLERALGAVGPVVMGVSTFPGEERMLAEAVRSLGLVGGTSGKPPRLVLVPRHAERAATVARELEAAGWQVWRRSAQATWPDDGLEGAQGRVLLVDSTGELRQWLELAEVAVIGKSWALSERGGQNPAEALEAGAAVICGPQMENFRALCAELLAAEALVQLADASGLATALAEMLADPELRLEQVERGRACLAGHQGATARTVTALRRRLGRASEKICVRE